MTQGREGRESTSLCKCCAVVVHLAHKLIGTFTNILSYVYIVLELHVSYTLCVCVSCHIKISAYSYFQTCKSLTT